jgi:mercuric ion transport protein
MKSSIMGVASAMAASACCIGPVAFSLIGAGTLGASAVKLEPYRPWLIGITVVLTGVALYSAYRRPSASSDCDAANCTLRSRRGARLLAWTAAILAGVLIAFPYYIGWFI